MELSNEVVLRPRFSLELTDQPETLLAAFENVGVNNAAFVISRIDDHVFIRFPKQKQHFWSPQLHLEIYKIEDQPTILKGLYGPSPTVWTLFMFLHFVIGILFIGAGIWVYTNIVLDEPFMIPVVALAVLFVLWFVLYFSGRLGKQAGKKEMVLLQNFLTETLKESRSY
jgi:hypothetical protein